MNDNDKSKVHGDVDSTIRIMMYIFPRQFGLHNVFTSHVDMSKTAQKFQDYTLREEELFSKFQKTTDGEKPRLHVRIPKRLRGELEHLIQGLQAFHARCSYAQLLQHYCPVRLTLTLHTFQLRRGIIHGVAPGSLPSRRSVTSPRNPALNVTMAVLRPPSCQQINFRGKTSGAGKSIDNPSQE